MTIRCPKCRTPSLLHASAIPESGRLERCPSCQITWLARRTDDRTTGRQAKRRRTATPAPSRIIEGDFVPHVRPEPDPRAEANPRAGVRFGSGRSAGTRRRKTGRYAAVAAVATLIAAAVLTPAVTALPDLTAVATGTDGMTLQSIRSRTVSLLGTDAILVEGEIFNESGRERAVPAVRIALKDGAAEVYSWLLEPTVYRVGAGGKVGFRSAMATPGNGAGQISLSLAGREEAR